MLSGDAIAHAPGISPLHDVKKSAGSPVRRAETVLLPSSMDAAPAAGTFSAARRKRRIGGARRDRTDDLKLAKLPLSQLSYGPVPSDARVTAGPDTKRPNATAEMVGLGRFELPTSRLSSARSNQLSYRPAGADASKRSFGFAPT